MKKIFLGVVVTGFAAVTALAQTSTSTNATTTTTTTNEAATSTPAQDPASKVQEGVEPTGTISPVGTAVYNRDTATTTDSMTTTASGTTTINQSGTQTGVKPGTAAGGATRSTTNTATTGAATGTTTAGDNSGGAVATLTDNQIAGVLVTINDAELETSKMALRRARLPEVREFAKRLNADHKSSLHDTKKVYRSYNKSTARSDVGVTLQSEAKSLTSELAKSTRDGFDKAYIDQQVILHEKALATLNESLLPNVTDETLKTHLEKTRTAVTEHLNEARDIQTKIQ